jgi:hypothetical protein
MKQPAFRKFQVLLLAAFTATAVFCTGCIVPPQQAVKTNNSPQSEEVSPESETHSPGKPLIKPTIPEESQTPRTVKPESDPNLQSIPLKSPEPEPQGATKTPLQVPTPPEQEASSESTQPSRETPSTAVQPSPRTPSPAVPAVPPKSAVVRVHQDKSQKRQWEDQKIKESAFEVAKGYPNVSKIKICYAVKDDEWWVTLYDDIGAAIDLKQFTWNRELEKLEPFLVLKRIPSNRLQAQLSEEEPGRACEILTVPREPEPPTP